MPESTGSTAVMALKRSKFSETLAAIGDGTLEQELSDLVVKLTAHLVAMGGGKATSKLNVSVTFKYDRGVFEVDANVSTKEPQVPRPRTMMYYDPRDGGLTRNDPRQMEAFAVKDAPAPTGPMRDVSSPVSVMR